MFLQMFVLDFRRFLLVIKMVAAAPYGVDWTSTIKLSDVEGKHTGNEKVIHLAKQVLGIDK